MKKILLFIILLTTLFLVGCNQEDKANKELVENTKEQLLTIIDRFGNVEDEDLEYESEAKFIGKGNVCIYEEDELIGLMLFDNDISILLQLELEESPRNTLRVWNVDISYIDTNKKIYIELSYYHYDEPLLSFKGDYNGENFDINIIEFTKGLSLFTINDIKEILTELGYTEINT